jgi:hypothetical protein
MTGFSSRPFFHQELPFTVGTQRYQLTFYGGHA